MDGAEGDWESMAETLTCIVEPQEEQRAVTVMSSIAMSEEKSNELFCPHLQATYFLRETMATTARETEADLINFLP